MGGLTRLVLLLIGILDFHYAPPISASASASTSFTTSMEGIDLDAAGGVEKGEVTSVLIERIGIPEGHPPLYSTWRGQLFFPARSIEPSYRSHPVTTLEIDKTLDSPGIFIAPKDHLQEVLIVDDNAQCYRLTATKNITHGRTSRRPQPPPRDQEQHF